MSYFLFVVLFSIFFFLYFKQKYGFWIMQPVFHVYDLRYYFWPPGIIDKHLPKKNKFTNFQNIQTYLGETVTSYQWQQFIHFVRLHYLPNPPNFFSPTTKQVTPYFYGHNHATFVTFYFKNSYLFDIRRQEPVNHAMITGIITSRPISISIFQKEKMDAYYVDYLCVDTTHRKSGVAPQLIQTHHYNQRHLNKKIAVTVFKREQELTGIVPLCVYTTYGFSIKQWQTHKLPLIEGLYKLVRVTSSNFFELHDFVSSSSSTFDLVMEANRGNQIELIKTENVVSYMLIEENRVVAAYFYRKTCVFIETDREILSCFASINQTESNIFIAGFQNSFWATCIAQKFGFAAIENIAHNNILIENMKETSIPLIQSPTAYFSYNFACSTFDPQKTFVFN